MATLETHREQAMAKQRMEKQRFVMKIGVGLGLFILGFLVLKYAPKVRDIVNVTVAPPPPREDIFHVSLVDNSGSASGWGLKEEASHEALDISQALGHPVPTVIARLGHQPVEIFTGVNNPEEVMKTFKDHYLKVVPDPRQDGTFLAPALENALTLVANKPNAILVITVAADSFDDPAATKLVATKLKNRGNVILIMHAVPVHDPSKASKVQMRLREDARKNFEPLGDDAIVIGKTEFPHVLGDWLPRKLKSKGYQP